MMNKIEKKPLVSMGYTKIFHRFNPITATLFNLNFHPLEVSENYSYLTKWRSTLFKSCWLMSLLSLTYLKGGI